MSDSGIVKYFNVNDRGVSIRCKMIFDEIRPGGRVIVCGTGFGGHKDGKAFERFARRILKKNKGFAILTFDWPGHGDDVKKKWMPEDCLLYLDCVLAWARKRFRTDNSHLFGYAVSFGGYIFLRYFAERGDPFIRTALRSPALPMHETLSASILQPVDQAALAAGRTVPVGFDRKVPVDARLLADLQSHDVTVLDYAPLSDRLMILHGTKDEIVPMAGPAAFAQKQGISFVPVEGADHRCTDPAQMEFAIEEIIRFFGLN